MKTALLRTTSLLAAAAALLVASPAQAVLQDHGPISTTNGFPRWYRDTGGLALEMCLAQTPSPNPASGGAPMCFPWAPDPAGYAGNIGDEQFWSAVDAIATGAGNFDARLVLALEAAYASGTPVRGEEIVFARVRIVMSVDVPGTYTVTHPYGVEVFPDVQPGPRAVFFTQDIGLAPGDFNGALGGRVGPFLQWDVLNPGETLTVTNAQGVVEEYLGDPNLEHTITGSPFGTNYFRIDGPPGSNLDGAGSDFIQTPLFFVVGKKYTAPIPTPLAIERASYTRGPAAATVDVFAKANPGQTLVVTGPGLPSMAMRADGNGKYLAHAEFAPDAILPAQVTVTNLSDVTLNQATSGVNDVVEVTSATFDPATGTLQVIAGSSDASAAPPALDVLGFVPGTMTAGVFTTLIPSGIPPTRVQVVSSAGGSHAADVILLATAPGNPANPPVAVDDAASTQTGTAVAIPVTANDLTPGTVVVLSRPAHGAIALDATTGVVTYTPGTGTFGPDAFTYVLRDAAGFYSNVATVSVDVAFVALPPTARADSASVARGAAVNVNVLANDTAAVGTTVDPASVLVSTPPVQGTVTVSATGVVTYTANPTFIGIETFQYTVANDTGVRSAPATVTVTVTGSVEILSNVRAQYETGKQRWAISGQSSVFGPTVFNTVTVYVGNVPAGGSGPLVGTAPIDGAGRFQLQITGAAPPDATRTITIMSTGGGRTTAQATVK